MGPINCKFDSKCIDKTIKITFFLFLHDKTIKITFFVNILYIK